MDMHHEANASIADQLHYEVTDEALPRDCGDDSAWRKFLTFYDSLQWQMYL